VEEVTVKINKRIKIIYQKNFKFSKINQLLLLGIKDLDLKNRLLTSFS
jgi:hypothetical protein